MRVTKISLVKTIFLPSDYKLFYIELVLALQAKQWTKVYLLYGM